MLRVKYPSTLYLPSKDTKPQDTYNGNLSHMEKLVITEKMDGENTSMYNNGIHFRSLDSSDSTPTLRDSRNWVRALHASIQSHIPSNLRIIGENLFAKHTIHYSDLSSYFQVFMIINDKDWVYSWASTQAIAENLGLHVVREADIINSKDLNLDNIRIEIDRNPNLEGYVIRNNNGFKFEDFSSNVFKVVKPNFVQTDTHWRHSRLIKNLLSKGD